MVVECCVCWSNFDTQIRPFVGACGHSLCSSCLPSLPNKKCPTCRIEGSFENAKENYLAKDLLQHISRLTDRPAPDSNQTLARVTELFHQQKDSSDVLHEALVATTNENLSLQKIVEELSEQTAKDSDRIQMLRAQLISLQEELAKAEDKNGELKDSLKEAEGKAEMKQQALDALRRQANSNFREWNNLFRSLNGNVTRSEEEQEEEEESEGEDGGDDEEESDDDSAASSSENEEGDDSDSSDEISLRRRRVLQLLTGSQERSPSNSGERNREECSIM